MNAPADLKFPSIAELKEDIAALSTDPAIDPLAIYAFNDLMRTSRELSVSLDKQFAAEGTSMARCSALWFIKQNSDDGGPTPAEIATGLQVTRATVTAVLNGLEKAKWISKQGSSRDGRQYHVQLTAAGRRTIDKIWPQQSAVITEFLGELSAPEKQLLSGLMEKIRTGVRTARADRDSGAARGAGTAT